MIIIQKKVECYPLKFLDLKNVLFLKTDD